MEKKELIVLLGLSLFWEEDKRSFPSLPFFKVKKKEEWNGFCLCAQSRLAPLMHPSI